MVTHKIKDYNKKYYEDHKEEIKLRTNLYRINNPSSRKNWDKKYNKVHKEEIKLRRINDPTYKEKRKIYSKKYRETHHEKIFISNKRYRENHKIQVKNHYNQNKLKIYENNKIRNKAIRLEVLRYYSNDELKCKKCGEDHLEFLEIDHIFGGGRKQMRETGYGSIYRLLKFNNYPDGYQVLCSNCNIKKVKVSARERAQTGTLSQKISYDTEQRLKNKVFSHYSIDGQIKCLCCEENDIDVLCLDHIHGDGNIHRKTMGLKGGKDMYRWIKNNDYPDTFRVLCSNCNKSLGNRGYCPHDTEMI